MDVADSFDLSQGNLTHNSASGIRGLMSTLYNHHNLVKTNPTYTPSLGTVTTGLDLITNFIADFTAGHPAIVDYATATMAELYNVPTTTAEGALTALTTAVQNARASAEADSMELAGATKFLSRLIDSNHDKSEVIYATNF